MKIVSLQVQKLKWNMVSRLRKGTLTWSLTIIFYATFNDPPPPQLLRQNYATDIEYLNLTTNKII